MLFQFSHLIFDMTSVGFTDTASTRSLISLLKEYEAIEVACYLVGCNGEWREPTPAPPWCPGGIGEPGVRTRSGEEQEKQAEQEQEETQTGEVEIFPGLRVSSVDISDSVSVTDCVRCASGSAAAGATLALKGIVSYLAV